MSDKAMVNDDQDIHVSRFAFNETQQSLANEVEAALKALSNAVSKLKRAKLVMVATGDAFYLSSREDHLNEHAEGAVFNASTAGALLAASSAGLSKRADRGEPGLLRLRLKKPLEQAMDLVIDRGNRGNDWIPGDIPLGRGENVNLIKEIREEYQAREKTGRAYHPWLRGNVVVFQDKPFRHA
jgi:hypothetical protein